VEAALTELDKIGCGRGVGIAEGGDKSEGSVERIGGGVG
jgi:hypothetical protein